MHNESASGLAAPPRLSLLRLAVGTGKAWPPGTVSCSSLALSLRIAAESQIEVPRFLVEFVPSPTLFGAKLDTSPSWSRPSCSRKSSVRRILLQNWKVMPKTSLDSPTLPEDNFATWSTRRAVPKFGCTTCHQIVTPGRMGLTGYGAKLKSMHMACTDVEKLLSHVEKLLSQRR
jgi:hypothetical protein